MWWKKLLKWLKSLVENNSDNDDSDNDDSGVDDLDLSKVKWLGDNYSNAQVEEIFNSASMDKHFINTDYKPYNWPKKTVKVSVDAICCIFYERGSEIVGGKFDWWRTGGQGTKTLENLYEGYHGHSFPVDGAKVWTCIVSVDSKKRSNVVKVSR